MENFPPITVSDVERYQQVRQLSRRLMSALTKTIPREAMQEIGKALGIMRDNILLLDTMDVSSVLMDSCLFDWIKDGKNLVEKYADAHPYTPGRDEHLLLQALCRAKYRLLVPRAISQGAVTYWLDTLWGGPIALMDIGLSQTMASGFRGLLATRTAPLGDYWMTTGAPLPVGDRKAGETVLKAIRRGNLLEDMTSAGEHKLAITTIRACLDSGVAEHVKYTGGDDEEEQKEFNKPSSVSQVKSPKRHVARNDPCPCRSGKKYKRCCLGK